jgi:hypothetical protein
LFCFAPCLSDSVLRQLRRDNEAFPTLASKFADCL